MTSLPVGGSSEDVVAEMIEPLIAMFVEQLDRCDDSDAVSTAATQILANQQVDRLVVLFNRTRNATFVWQAFQLYREWKLPVREDVLRMFDEMASRLMDASSDREMLRALGLIVSKKGGAQGPTAARRAERPFEIALHFKTLLHAGFSRDEALKCSAKTFAIEISNLERIVSQQKRKPTARVARKRASAALEALPVRRHYLR